METLGLGRSRELTLPLTKERQFTDPYVRFRRINGRIVPLINKHKIGRVMSESGRKVAVGGVAIAGAGAIANFVRKRIEKPKPFKIKFNAFNGNTYKVFEAATRSPAVKRSVINKSIRFLARHPVKFGAGLAIGGIMASGYGWDMQASSPMGKDY
jgi:hypothetical protein